MSSTAVRDHQRVIDGAAVSFGRNAKWSFHERTISTKLRDLARGAITLSRFMHYSVRFFHLEGISNYIDEEFEQDWEEDLFIGGDSDGEEEEYYTPPGKKLCTRIRFIFQLHASSTSFMCYKRPCTYYLQFASNA